MSFEKNYEVSAQEISRIYVDCTICRIYLRETAGENIRFSYSDTGCRTLKLDRRGNTLDVSEKAAFTMYEIFNLIELNKDKALLIEVPSSYTGELVVSAAIEPVTLDNLNFSGMLTIHTQVAEIQGQRVRAKEIRLSSHHGRIALSELEPEVFLSMDTNIGGIQCSLREQPAGYNIFAQSQHGSWQVPPSDPAGKVRVHATSITGSVMIGIV